MNAACAAGPAPGTAGGVPNIANGSVLAAPDPAIALAGFDDIPIARYVTPPLTTVHVPIAELGRRAFALAICDEEQRHETLPTTLVIRESCGATIKKEEG